MCVCLRVSLKWRQILFPYVWGGPRLGLLHFVTFHSLGYSSWHGTTTTQSQGLLWWAVLPTRWSTSTLCSDCKRVSSSSLSTVLVWKAGQRWMATMFTWHQWIYSMRCCQEQGLWEKSPHSEWIERLHFRCIHWNLWRLEIVSYCVSVCFGLIWRLLQVEDWHFEHLGD